jgi:putative chitinase
MISLDQLKQILPLSGRRAATFCQPLNDAMREFGIDTPARQASFIAQVGHESGQFVYVREIASGSAYEGRADLGNTHPGDGVRYKGRGLIQVTGRANYTACMLALDIDCVEHPELLEQPVNACRSAAWFWKAHGLNELADAGDQKAVCKRVNGGYNGLAERLAFFDVAQRVLA